MISSLVKCKRVEHPSNSGHAKPRRHRWSGALYESPDRLCHGGEIFRFNSRCMRLQHQFIMASTTHARTRHPLRSAAVLVKAAKVENSRVDRVVEGEQDVVSVNIYLDQNPCQTCNRIQLSQEADPRHRSLYQVFYLGSCSLPRVQSSLQACNLQLLSLVLLSAGCLLFSNISQHIWACDCCQGKFLL